MSPMIFASLIVMASMASAGTIYSVPLTYVALRSVPENIYNHVQDTRTGEYAFGYSGGPVAREESKTADGVTRGAYSYVDAHGIVQHYRYIADDDGFRVAGTNIPTDAGSATPVVLEPQVVPESEAIVTEAKSAESQSRRKRSIGYSEIPVALEAVSAPLAIASVPTATSSQSRVQIHNNFKTEIPVETVAAIPAAPVEVPAVAVATKAIEVLPEAVPVAVAASVPVATSSQSRFQIHKSLKAEIPVETVAALPAAPVEVPAVAVATKAIEVLPEAVPVAVAASVPIATSSQSRFQIHKSLKAEIPVETVASIPAAPVAIPAVQVAAKTIEVLPKAVPVLESVSVPVATSSQSRFQIHKSSKIETSAPIAVEAVQAVPVAPITVAAATSTSNQRRFQVHGSSNLELNALHQPLGYGVVKIQPAIAIHSLNSDSLIARSPVGVGLGIVPSPVAAYHGAALLAQA